MSFIVTSEKPAGSSRYEKVGRVLAGDDGCIHIICDGEGEIGTFLRTDIVCVLQGLSIPGLSVSDSGKGLIFARSDQKAYLFLAWQAREMIRSWPKKKAALFKFRVNSEF